LQPREFHGAATIVLTASIEIGEIIHFDASKQEIREAIIPRANWRIIAFRFFTIGIELNELYE